ncbi:MAG: selenocysteine synthase [Puia sp.]|nr:selenocysteine synthase [Puia sp.]
MNRRDIIKGLSLLSLPISVKGETLFFESSPASPLSAKRDLFKELGVRTFINARGTITAMSGSLMHDYVVETIKDSSRDFCMLDELQDKVGEKIAALTHAESAMVTSGAFSALMLGMAGILTGMDPEKVKQIPQLAGTEIKSEVIIQKSHQIDYNHAFINCGVKLVYVETPDDVDKAVNEKTASMHFLGSGSLSGKIKEEEWVALANKHRLPASIDMAANVPPVSNIWKFNDIGFSYVALSGGKAIRGPQSAGILMGKKEIVAAARLNASPHSGTIGRGMKVNKEEILAMYVALEHFINFDQDKLWKEWQAGIDRVGEAAKKINGVRAETFVPPIADHVPTLKISWDTDKIKISGEQMLDALRKGEPSIEAYGGGRDFMTLTTWMMRPDQINITARRIKEELAKAAV